jgi:3-oxoacyl-[acyl-carrier protein] reductase
MTAIHVPLLGEDNRMGLLQNRVALVTGAGRGIGRAIALAFGREGARIVVTARTTAELAPVADEIAKSGGQALAVSADLAAPGAVENVLAQTRARFGAVEILVNNAGIGSSSDPKPVVAFDDAFWDLTLRLNLTVPYLLCKAVLPDMLARKWGRIINIASINSKIGSFHGAAYAASKHGLLGLTRTLALEVARDGLTVNAICPGPVHTIMNDRRIEYDARRRGVSFEEQASSLTPMGRRLEPVDIAPLAVYLASNAAALMTGQAINLDGGTLMA